MYSTRTYNIHDLIEIGSFKASSLRCKYFDIIDIYVIGKKIHITSTKFYIQHNLQKGLQFQDLIMKV